MDGVSYFVLERKGFCASPGSGCTTPDLDLYQDFEGDPDLLLELEDDSEDDLLDEVRVRVTCWCVAY